MKKWIIGALAIGGWIAVAGAWENDSKELMKSCMSNVKSQCQEWVAAGGGSGNPRGLTNEVSVELSMGERYLMSGVITIYRNQALLEIDFKQHPWLQSRRRIMNPYYRINVSDLERWKKYNRKYVTFAAVAQGAIFADEEGKKSFDMILEPTSDPQIDSVKSAALKR